MKQVNEKYILDPGAKFLTLGQLTQDSFRTVVSSPASFYSLHVNKKKQMKKEIKKDAKLLVMYYCECSMTLNVTMNS